METTDILIVGGGAVGLACAWALKERDSTTRVHVVDAGEFACGGSGRNGAAFRTLWSRDFNIMLSKESLDVFRDAKTVFDYPAGIDLNESGYLLAAHDDATIERFNKVVSKLNPLGISCEALDPRETMERCPGLSGQDLRGGIFGAECGTLSPFRYLDAVLTAIRRKDVSVDFARPVQQISPEGEDYLVTTPSGVIAASKVVICTDWAAPELLSPLGIDLPISRYPKEAMVTEPVPHQLGVSLGIPSAGLFIKQLVRGNFILTMTMDRHEEFSNTSTPGWMTKCAAESIKFYPDLANTSVLRSWPGIISKTPDMQAILGETDLNGLYVAISAYKGIMLSPAMGKVLAELILTGKTSHPAKALRPMRFREGRLKPELLTI